MRLNLKLFRIKNKLTQLQIAEMIGCSRATYSFIESGKRGGTHNFWSSLQRAFDVPDEEMYPLMRTDEKE